EHDRQCRCEHKGGSTPAHAQQHASEYWTDDRTNSSYSQRPTHPGCANSCRISASRQRIHSDLGSHYSKPGHESCGHEHPHIVGVKSYQTDKNCRGEICASEHHGRGHAVDNTPKNCAPD